MKYLGKITDPKDLVTKEYAETYTNNNLKFKMPLTLGDLTGNHTIADSDHISMAAAPSTTLPCTVVYI